MSRETVQGHSADRSLLDRLPTDILVKILAQVPFTTRLPLLISFTLSQHIGLQLARSYVISKFAWSKLKNTTLQVGPSQCLQSLGGDRTLYRGAMGGLRYTTDRRRELLQGQLVRASVELGIERHRTSFSLLVAHACLEQDSLSRKYCLLDAPLLGLTHGWAILLMFDTKDVSSCSN